MKTGRYGYGWGGQVMHRHLCHHSVPQHMRCETSHTMQCRCMMKNREGWNNAWVRDAPLRRRRQRRWIQTLIAVLFSSSLFKSKRKIGFHFSKRQFSRRLSCCRLS
jgi:hypothetical protein